MVGIKSVVGILKALAVASWRDVRSLGSIGGQNLFLFVLFVALQPESAAFFGLIFAAVLLIPLSTDPLRKFPLERRVTWPILRWEWGVIRIASLLLSPIAWLALVLLVRAGWRMGGLVAACALAVQAVKYFVKWVFERISRRMPLRIPAPPGAIGALMRIQWRGMLHTLDPYAGCVLMIATSLYRMFGKALDPAAPRIIALVVALAISTETQVLFGIDGRGAERYRLLPIRGWQVLLAKDLAFLVLLGLLVAPLDFMSGFFGGLAALTIGHHRSVLKPIPQTRWRFTGGALFPDGAMQTVALFAVGLAIRTEGLPLTGFCVLAWLLSIFIYGRQWDRRKSFD